MMAYDKPSIKLERGQAEISPSTTCDHFAMIFIPAAAAGKTKSNSQG
jgi:hypothetical protein